MDGAATHLESAIGALKSQDLERAVFHLRAFLTQEPDEGQAWGLLGETLATQNRPSEALDALNEALRLDPEADRARFHRARLLDALDRPEDALADMEALAQRHPSHGDILHNLALLRRHLGDWTGSEACLRQVIALAPDRMDSHLALAHALLARGAWTEGFAQYEARLALPGWQRASIPASLWDGTPLAGRSLLVTAEQGLGDGVQFLRYIPLIRGAGRLAVEAHPPLIHLLEMLPNVDRVVPFTPDGIPTETDLRIALGSLPGLVAEGMPLSDTVPYIPLATVPRQAREDGPTIGLAWRSSDRPELKRDPPLEALAPLGRIPGIRWVSLQWDGAPVPFPLETAPIASARDLLDTARLISGLDGVVTVDTVVAHLAGALGKPAWVLLGSRSDWRWGVEGTRTPWYPTAHLFRRDRAPSWKAPLAALTKDLEATVIAP